jgi:hypothetical protein
MIDNDWNRPLTPREASRFAIGTAITILAVMGMSFAFWMALFTVADQVLPK